MKNCFKQKKETKVYKTEFHNKLSCYIKRKKSILTFINMSLNLEISAK